jgi:hypothetical protein
LKDWIYFICRESSLYCQLFREMAGQSDFPFSSKPPICEYSAYQKGAYEIFNFEFFHTIFPLNDNQPSIFAPQYVHVLRKIYYVTLCTLSHRSFMTNQDHTYSNDHGWRTSKPGMNAVSFAIILSNILLHSCQYFSGLV